MPKELSVAAFDYSSIDKDVKGKLINLAGVIKRHAKQFKQAGDEIGQAISDAHKLLADQRKGLFEQWVECETEIGLSTAYNLKNLWERASDFPIIGKLPPTVAYMMAAPGTSASAIKAMEKAVGKGAKPTLELAKATIKEYAEPKPKQATKAPATASPPVPKTPAQNGHAPHVAPTKADAKDDAVGPLFTKLLEHLRQSVLLLDQINKIAPDGKIRQEVFDSLEVANQDIIRWRKSAKNRS